jgi:hypothetical protein
MGVEPFVSGAIGLIAAIRTNETGSAMVCSSATRLGFMASLQFIALISPPSGLHRVPSNFLNFSFLVCSPGRIVSCLTQFNSFGTLLEFLFEVPVIAMGSDPFTPRLLIALLLSFGATFFWFQFRRAA